MQRCIRLRTLWLPINAHQALLAPDLIAGAVFPRTRLTVRSLLISSPTGC